MSEAVYDSQIKEKLEEIIEICKSNDIGIALNLQLTNGDNAEFVSAINTNSQPHTVFQMITAAIQAQGNFDAFMFWALKYTDEVCKGVHSSIFINLIKQALSDSAIGATTQLDMSEIEEIPIDAGVQVDPDTEKA